MGYKPKGPAQATSLCYGATSTGDEPVAFLVPVQGKHDLEAHARKAEHRLQACATGGTRPGPVARVLHQSGLYGIPFDVSLHALEFARTSNPVIKGFFLPESAARPTQQRVSSAGGRPLQAARDPRKRNMRGQQGVNMIRHHHMRVEVKEPEFECALPESLRNKPGNSFIPQPSRPELCSVQFAVYEGVSFPLAHGLVVERFPYMCGQGAVQSPGDKERRSRWMPMGQVSSVKEGLLHAATVAQAFSLWHFWSSGTGKRQSAGYKPVLQGRAQAKSLCY